MVENAFENIRDKGLKGDAESMALASGIWEECMLPKVPNLVIHLETALPKALLAGAVGFLRGPEGAVGGFFGGLAIGTLEGNEVVNQKESDCREQQAIKIHGK